MKRQDQYESSAKVVFICCSFVGLVTLLTILALAITG